MNHRLQRMLTAILDEAPNPVDAEFVAEVGWATMAGHLYVNADDLIALLRTGGYGELADDFARIADEERTA